MKLEELLLRVEISAEDGGLYEKKGTTRDGGRAYHMRWQTGYVYLGGAYPEKFDLMLDEGQPAFSPGMYYVDSRQSTRVDEHKLRSAWRMKMVPVGAFGSPSAAK